jgi:uncharacterized protein
MSGGTHRASRYNFFVRTASGGLLYNVSSGALARLEDDDGEELGRLLGSSCLPQVIPGEFPEALWNKLVAAGFIVNVNVDETAIVKERFWEARHNAPLVVTLTVTQDCNLGCYYCYEERSADKLNAADIGPILARLDQSLAQNPRQSIHVDWYGGEPLLNVEFIETASRNLQAYAADHGMKYSASIISNGTAWPKDPQEFVVRHRIREVQVSFDGDREQHEKYRRYRKGVAQGSFDEAVRVVEALRNVCKVSVRLNVDRKSVESLEAFLGFATERGWFEPSSRTVLQPARLAAFSARSGFMQDWQLTVSEFEGVKARIRRILGDHVRIEEAETVDGFPRPKTSVCAALGAASFVVGADAKEYRCGLQVGERGRAVASLKGKGRSLQVFTGDDEHQDRAFWEAFDPTQQASCSKCSFLPICWGGCPKRHLEGDAHAIAEQGRYWRENLARLIAHRVGETPHGPMIFDDAIQFRGIREACDP